MEVEVDGNEFTLGGCDYSISKFVNSAFFFNDRNYQWASKNCAHVETLNTVLILSILSKRRCSDPSRSRPRPFFKKIQTESVATNYKGYALY